MTFERGDVIRERETMIVNEKGGGGDLKCLH
jgi:hypothetical protein